jgi:dihydrodipicolinate synthase/N-acetylneuraminate lyase
MFDVDGALVGYGGLAPEPLIELIAAGKAKDYAKARAINDRLLPVTRTVYHRGSHMEGTVALKHGLVARASSSTQRFVHRCCRLSRAPRSKSRTINPQANADYCMIQPPPNQQ